MQPVLKLSHPKWWKATLSFLVALIGVLFILIVGLSALLSSLYPNVETNPGRMDFVLFKYESEIKTFLSVIKLKWFRAKNQNQKRFRAKVKIIFGNINTRKIILVVLHQIYQCVHQSLTIHYIKRLTLLLRAIPLA